MKKIPLIISVLLLAAFIFLGYCQDPAGEENLKIFRGIVAEADWVGSKLVVKTTDPDPSDESTFTVSDDTQIVKGTYNISFGEIEDSDKVAVVYRVNSFAGLEAVRVTVWE